MTRQKGQKFSNRDELARMQKKHDQMLVENPPDPFDIEALNERIKERMARG